MRPDEASVEPRRVVALDGEGDNELAAESDDDPECLGGNDHRRGTIAQ